MPVEAKPNTPIPVEVHVPSATTAILVLDVGMRALEEEEAAHGLLKPIAGLLDRARSHGAHIAYTIMVGDEGTPNGDVATPLNRRDDEPVLYPLGYDKLRDGVLAKILEGHGTTDVIVVGASTHLCVLYTATVAARNHGYHVVVPLDGVASRNPYEHEYSIHQLTVLPALPIPISFSETSLIHFD
jgi:nicotinamidase-related amidase